MLDSVLSQGIILTVVYRCDERLCGCGKRNDKIFGSLKLPKPRESDFFGGFDQYVPYKDQKEESVNPKKSS